MSRDFYVHVSSRLNTFLAASAVQLLSTPHHFSPSSPLQRVTHADRPFRSLLPLSLTSSRAFDRVQIIIILQTVTFRPSPPDLHLHTFTSITFTSIPSPPYLHLHNLHLHTFTSIPSPPDLHHFQTFTTSRPSPLPDLRYLHTSLLPYLHALQYSKSHLHISRSSDLYGSMAT